MMRRAASKSAMADRTIKLEYRVHAMWWGGKLTMTDNMTEIEALEIATFKLASIASDIKEQEAVETLIRRLERLREAREWAERPYTHKAVGFRFHVPYELERKSLDEAVAAAYWGVQDNTFTPDRITDTDGAVVLDYPALQAAMDAYDEKNKA